MPDKEYVYYLVLMLSTDFASYMDDGTLINKHEGVIFANPAEAKQYAKDAVSDHMCNKFSISWFVSTDPNLNETYLHEIETFGFKNDKNNMDKMHHFKPKQWQQKNS